MDSNFRPKTHQIYNAEHVSSVKLFLHLQNRDNTMHLHIYPDFLKPVKINYHLKCFWISVLLDESGYKRKIG